MKDGWSEDEIEVLVSTFRLLTTRELEKLLGRSKNSINNQVVRLKRGGKIKGEKLIKTKRRAERQKVQKEVLEGLGRRRNYRKTERYEAMLERGRGKRKREAVLAYEQLVREGKEGMIHDVEKTEKEKEES